MNEHVGRVTAGQEQVPPATLFISFPPPSSLECPHLHTREDEEEDGGADMNVL